MPSSMLTQSAKLRAGLFVTCAACTLWLLVQNTILFTLVPWHRLPDVLEVSALQLRATAIIVVPLSLLPMAFALGWLIARRATLATESGEKVHE